MDADGSNLKRLTRSPRLDDYPVFSPDGRRIAFTSNRDRNFEIYVMNADGSEPRNLTRNPAIDQFPAWRSGSGRQPDMSARRETDSRHHARHGPIENARFLLRLSRGDVVDRQRHRAGVP